MLHVDARAPEHPRVLRSESVPLTCTTEETRTSEPPHNLKVTVAAAARGDFEGEVAKATLINLT